MIIRDDVTLRLWLVLWKADKSIQILIQGWLLQNFSILKKSEEPWVYYKASIKNINNKLKLFSQEKCLL